MLSNSINSGYFQFPLKQEYLSNIPSNDVHMACSGITSCELAACQGYNVLFVGVSHNLTTSVQAKDLIDESGYLRWEGQRKGLFSLLDKSALVGAVVIFGNHDMK